MDKQLKTILVAVVAVLALAVAVWQGVGYVQGPKEEVVGDLGDLSGGRDGAKPEAGAEGKVDASGAPEGAPTQ